MKTPLTVLRCVKYVNEMTDAVIHSTHQYIKYVNVAILANLQHRSLKRGRLIVLEETHQRLWKKVLFPWQLTLSHSPPTWFQNVSFFSSKSIKLGHKLELTYLYAGWIMLMKHHWQISKWNANSRCLDNRMKQYLSCFIYYLKTKDRTGKENGSFTIIQLYIHIKKICRFITFLFFSCYPEYKILNISLFEPLATLLRH